ncbi:zinc finger protein 319-like [Schistocerca nitens]|uniref:zinc finger protein 319-like n=1 Tax=Schistocerca nitens TaxID=7011 RepID=UPI002117EFEE|nr:zinc finger protein 319-like [Schistocerca nitens]
MDQHWTNILALLKQNRYEVAVHNKLSRLKMDSYILVVLNCLLGSAEWFTWPGGSQAAPVDKKGPFTCPVCLRIYRRSRSLWRHQRYECSTEWRSWPGASLSSELDKDGPFPCPACQRIYRRRRSLWRHQRYECNKPAQFHCPFCSYSAKQKCSVKLHVSKKHSVPDENAFRINYIQDSLDDM